MIVGSIKEDLILEKRVSLTPETAKNIIGLGLKVCIEKDYASHLGIQDYDYKKVGVEIRASSNDVINSSKAIIKVNCPSENEIRRLAINFGVANAMFVGMANIMLLLKGNDEDRDLWFARVGEALMGLNIIFQVPVVGTGLEYAYNTYAKDKPRPVDDIVNPLTATVRKSLKRSDKYNMSELESAAITIAELKLGVQFDPAIGLAYGIGEELFDVDSPQDFDDNMYDLFGITPSYRPSYGQKKSKFEGVVPLNGIKTKADLKRFNPDLYDKIYGKQDSIRKAQRELEKERLRKAGLEKIGNSYYPIKD